MQNQITFRDRLLNVLMIDFAAHSDIVWKIYVDAFVINVGIRKLTDHFIWREILANPPIEIVRYEDWMDGPCSCLFEKNGFIAKRDSSTYSCTDKPDYVGLFEPGFRDSRDHFVYTSDFSYYLLPIPISCTVRDMTPEEKLLLSHYEAMPPDERVREDERMEMDRQKLIQKLQAKAGLTLKEALLEFMKFDLNGMSTDRRARIKEAVMLYSRPEFNSLSKVAKEFKVTSKTVSTWLKTFADKTGFQVVQFERHQSVRDQAKILKSTGAKHIPKRLSSDM